MLAETCSTTELAFFLPAILAPILSAVGAGGLASGIGGGFMGTALGAGLSTGVQGLINTAILTGISQGATAASGGYDKPPEPHDPVELEGTQARAQRVVQLDPKTQAPGTPSTIVSPLARGQRSERLAKGRTILGPKATTAKPSLGPTGTA